MTQHVESELHTAEPVIESEAAPVIESEHASPQDAPESPESDSKPASNHRRVVVEPIEKVVNRLERDLRWERKASKETSAKLLDLIKHLQEQNNDLMERLEKAQKWAIKTNERVSQMEALLEAQSGK